MIYFTAFYCILSAFGVVVDLVSMHFIAAFCVAILSAAALNGGRALKIGATFGTPLQRIRRCIIALLQLALAVWLSYYPVNLIYYVVPGLTWVIIGAAIGLIVTPEGHHPSRARMH